MRNDTRFWTSAALGIAAVNCGPQRAAHQPVQAAQTEDRDLDASSQAGGANSRGSLPQGNPRAQQEPSAKADIGGGAPNTGAENGDQGAQRSNSNATASAATANTEPHTKTRPPTPNSGIVEICEKIARRANAKCNKQVAGLYQSSCAHYVQKPGTCDEPIRLALECQYKATEDLFCAHGADHNCSQVNRELKICQRGSAPEEQTTTEDDRTLPPGWEQIEDTQLGFTVAMPPGAALDPASKRRTWKAEVDGIAYYVAAIEPPTGNLNNQAFVRAVVSYVGGRCQLHLKLNGELEFKGSTVVQYHSACPDKTEWHGMLHFWNGKAVSTGYHATPGMTGVREPFFYSFSIKK